MPTSSKRTSVCSRVRYVGSRSTWRDEGRQYSGDRSDARDWRSGTDSGRDVRAGWSESLVLTGSRSRPSFSRFGVAAMTPFRWSTWATAMNRSCRWAGVSVGLGSAMTGRSSASAFGIAGPQRDSAGGWTVRSRPSSGWANPAVRSRLICGGVLSVASLYHPGECDASTGKATSFELSVVCGFARQVRAVRIDT